MEDELELVRDLSSDKLQKLLAYGKPFQMGFLPRDAMLARYVPSSCVCPSFCLSHATPVSYQNA